MSNCIFCTLHAPERKVAESEYVVAYWDLNPVSPGHVIIFPKRHVESWFELTNEEVSALYALTKEARTIVEERFHPDAYNIGVNEGEVAGRVIHHVHTHLIPRYKGDVEDPRGGIRHVIPGKGYY